MKRYSLFVYFLFFHYLAIGQHNSLDCPADSSGSKVVYTLVDHMPVHPKGQGGFLAELYAGDFWPKMDLACYFDKVWITFTVGTDGNLSDLSTQISDDISCIQAGQLSELKKQLDEGLGETLDEMTPWIPGECKGVKVPVRCRFPVRLHLDFD